MRIRRALILIVFCLAGTAMSAQHRLSGTLASKGGGSPVEGGYVLLIQDGQVVNSAASGKDGRYSISGIPAGSYGVEVAAVGFVNIRDSLDISRNCTRNYVLEEEILEIEGAEITENRSTMLPNGERFYLSEDAKKLNNPFVALQEIPLIDSDPSTSTVKMRDGSSVLVLIDGKEVNSGISPILPDDIESVDVISVVSARYLVEGIRYLINIKRKRVIQPYVWVQASTRHEVPLDHGNGVGQFEIGNRKISLYGQISDNYTYHDDNDGSISRSNDTGSGYTQSYDQKIRYDGNTFLGRLLLKYQPGEKDYLAANFNYTRDKMTGKGSGDGLYATDTEQTYSFISDSRNASGIMTASLYYMHTFSEDNTLEASAEYNFNNNGYDSDRTEYYDEDPFETALKYINQRRSGKIFVNWEKGFENGSSISVSSSTSLTSDRINYVTDNSLFRHSDIREVLHAGYSGSYKTLYYFLSLGLDGRRITTSDISNKYLSPLCFVTLNWHVNGHNSLQLYYGIWRKVPSVAYLNPNNVSTDPKVIEEGNSTLKAVLGHNCNVQWSFNSHGFYLIPKVQLRQSFNNIEDSGWTDENGVYHSSYSNSGRYSELNLSAQASYSKTGKSVIVIGGWKSYYYSGQKPKNAWNINVVGNYRLKNFNFHADLAYESMTFTQYSYTANLRPTAATVQVMYNITPDLYIAAALQYFTGATRSKTMMENAGYRSETLNRFPDKCLRPWIQISYTFRRHIEKKHRLGDVLSDEAEGISVIRQ